MATKKITLNELRTLVKQIIKEEINNVDLQLKKNIDNLSDNDLQWSTNPNIGLAIQYDDVNEELLKTQLLNLIKKVNPNVDVERKREGISFRFNELSDNLYSATQKSFSDVRGLKDFFEDNLQLFK
jgi:hypothetical protein